jgi:hypothetical protein
MWIMNWKWCGMVQLWSNLRYRSVICMKGMWKTSHDSQCHEQYMNQMPFKYKSEALLTRPTCSLFWRIKLITRYEVYSFEIYSFKFQLSRNRIIQNILAKDKNAWKAQTTTGSVWDSGGYNLEDIAGNNFLQNYATYDEINNNFLILWFSGLPHHAA